MEAKDKLSFNAALKKVCENQAAAQAMLLLHSPVFHLSSVSSPESTA